jgi:hypothetical protein
MEMHPDTLESVGINVVKDASTPTATVVKDASTPTTCKRSCIDTNPLKACSVVKDASTPTATGRFTTESALPIQTLGHIQHTCEALSEIHTMTHH